MSVEELIKSRQFEIEEYGQFYDGTFHEDFCLTHLSWSGLFPIHLHVIKTSAYNVATRPVELTEEQKPEKVTFKEPVVYGAKRLLFPVKSKKDIDDTYQLIGTIIDTYPDEKFEVQNNYSSFYGILPEYQEERDKMLEEKEQRLSDVRNRIEEILEKELNGSFFEPPEENSIVNDYEIPKEWYGQRYEGFINLLFVILLNKSSFSSFIHSFTH